MEAGIEITDKNDLFTYLRLTDRWYELDNFWRLNDGYTHKLKFINGKYDRVPGYCLFLYGTDRDGSRVRALRLDLQPSKYPFKKGYISTGEIYKEAALDAEAGKIEYRVTWVD